VSVIAFPSPLLSDADEAAIAARVVASRYYTCKRTTLDDGQPAMALLNRSRKIRGYVTKKHGVFAVLDARRALVAQGRELDEVLSVLLK
jgi:hypothetical protein